MKDKIILVVNDDGIDSDGIYRLANAAKTYGQVYVIAPDSQRSATSHKINYDSEISVWEYDLNIDDVKAYACDGSPADCVRVGIKLLGRKPDVICAGINKGYNIASDIQYSATVGAALEGAFWGVHSVAFSQDYSDNHEVVDKYLVDIMGEYIDKKLDNYKIWNINFPACPLEECKGILRDRVVSKDDFYDDDYSLVKDNNGILKLKVIPKRNWVGSENTDMYAVYNNYISIGIVNNIG